MATNKQITTAKEINQQLCESQTLDPASFMLQIADALKYSQILP